MGAEIEFYRLGQEALRGLDAWMRYTIHDDGSLRDTTYTAGDLAVYPEEDERGEPIMSLGMRQRSKIGLEVISQPYAYEDFLPIAQKFSYVYGQVPQSSRTSIHIHVDAHQETWREVQRLLKWAHALEAIIYRVACNGEVHRGARSYKGEANDHKFARPLSAPIGVRYMNGETKALIDMKQMMGAKSASEFVAGWGRLDTYWGDGLQHYMPHRLHMVNIASLLRTGTIEWRVFDGLYRYFDTILSFVYHVHKLASKGQDPDFAFPLGESPGVDAAWVSNLLEMDISPLWGTQWQKGCIHKAPISHYPNQPVLPSLSDLGVRIISNGQTRDGGGDAESFVLYYRR